MLAQMLQSWNHGIIHSVSGSNIILPLCTNHIF